MAQRLPLEQLAMALRVELCQDKRAAKGDHVRILADDEIDVAIARGLPRVEAGAQGGHKLARGYAPEPTWSAHYIPNASFRRAVAGFLEAEREEVQRDRQWLAQRTPFRKGG